MKCLGVLKRSLRFMSERMMKTTPHSAIEFKQKAALKGWSMANLAFHWGLSAAWLSVLIRDRGRKPYWDEALDGLAHLSRRESRELTRRRLEEKQRDRERTGRTPVKLPPPGYRYRNYLVPRSVVVSTAALFDLPEGVRGHVLATKDTGTEEHYLIDLEGHQDWFSPEYVDRYFASTGEILPH